MQERPGCRLTLRGGVHAAPETQHASLRFECGVIMQGTFAMGPVRRLPLFSKTCRRHCPMPEYLFGTATMVTLRTSGTSGFFSSCITPCWRRRTVRRLKSDISLEVGRKKTRRDCYEQTGRTLITSSNFDVLPELLRRWPAMADTRLLKVTPAKCSALCCPDRLK